ncbi:MAG: hypothetical protein WDA24_00265 [Tissierellales bacterium]
MKEIIKRHKKEYPLSTLQDWYKLFYQSAFGNAHLACEKDECMQFLKEELDSLDSVDNLIGIKDIKLVEYSSSWVKEDIGNGFYRVNLNWIKEVGFSLDILVKMMLLSKDLSKEAFDKEGYFDYSVFDQYVLALEELLEEEDFDFTLDDLIDYEIEYEDKGYPLLSHSYIYKLHYRPAYRVIHEKYAKHIELIHEIKKKINKVNRPSLIAIDGMAASGKTSFAKVLNELFYSNLFHMDDFFLPNIQKTQTRLSAPGGNVDYERFRREVLDNIGIDLPFMYEVFNCMDQSYLPKKVEPKLVNIVEGAYSMHPYFQDPYDIKIFMKTDYEIQKERILKRSNMELLERFEKEWIPLENFYIKSFSIEEKADYVIKT